MREQFPYSFDFTPAQVKVLPVIQGQSKVLKNGDVRAWFTKAQFDDVKFLVDAILDGESNIFSKERELEYEIPNF